MLVVDINCQWRDALARTAMLQTRAERANLDPPEPVDVYRHVSRCLRVDAIVFPRLSPRHTVLLSRVARAATLRTDAFRGDGFRRKPQVCSLRWPMMMMMSYSPGY